jgi:hypothetical protein
MIRPVSDPAPAMDARYTAARGVGWLALLTIEAGALAACFGPLDPAGLERWRARFYSGSWVVTRPSLVVAAATVLTALAWSRW